MSGIKEQKYRKKSGVITPDCPSIVQSPLPLPWHRLLYFPHNLWYLFHCGRFDTEKPVEFDIRDVTFSYQSGRPVLKNISLKIHPKQKIALVGYNGSGAVDSRGEINTTVLSFAISFISWFSWYSNVLMDIGKNTKKESYDVEQALYEAHFTLQDCYSFSINSQSTVQDMYQSRSMKDYLNPYGVTGWIIRYMKSRRVQYSFRENDWTYICMETNI